MLVDDIVIGLTAVAAVEGEDLYKETLPRFIKALDRSSRFNLKDNVVKAVTNLLATKATVLEAYIDFARRPTHDLWIEFPAAPRVELLATLGIKPEGKQPSRVGVYIDDNPDHPGDLQCGRALVTWKHQHIPIAECGYTQLLWNFRPDWVDWRTPEQKATQEREAISRSTSVLWLHKASKLDVEAHCRLMSRFTVSQAWVHEYAVPQILASKTTPEIQRFVNGSISDATSEAIMVIASLLMFNIRKTLAYEPMTFEKLNKERKKKNKPPLYSYTNASFYLTPAKQRSYAARGMTVKEGVVLQRVIGHPRERFSKKRNQRELIWIEPFYRGDSRYGLGKSITHTKTVRIPV